MILLSEMTFPVELGNARRRWTQKTSLILTITDEQGHQGCGEASPLPGYSRDTLEDCRREITALTGDLACANLRSPAARFALETALRELGVTPPLPVRRDIATIPRCALVETPAAAVRALAAGARTIKLKIGPDPELAVVAAVRAAIGDDVPLRLDANGTLPPAEARAMVAALARFQPELIEEPVPPEFLGGAPWAVPVALDESLAGMAPDDLAAFAPTVSAVVLKPMALGGARPCLAFAQRAHELGMRAIVTHMFDGPIALAATRALAAALPAPPLACALEWSAA